MCSAAAARRARGWQASTACRPLQTRAACPLHHTLPAAPPRPRRRPAHALHFAVYEAAKGVYGGNAEGYQFVATAAAGATATTVNDLFMTPVDVVKQRLQVGGGGGGGHAPPRSGQAGAHAPAGGGGARRGRGRAAGGAGAAPAPLEQAAERRTPCRACH